MVNNIYGHLDVADGVRIGSDDVILTLEQNSTTYDGVDAVLSTKQNFHIIVDSDNNDTSTGGFTIRRGSTEVDTSAELFRVSPAGEVTVSNSYKLPTTDGSNGTFLFTDGDGQAYWGYQLNVEVANTIAQGTGVTIDGDANTGWVVNIGQSVETTANVVFDTVSADLVGDVTGNVLGNVTGNVLGDVTGTVSTLQNHNTSDLSEGSNLYFTTQRARDSITAGTGLVYSNGQFSVDSTIATQGYVSTAIAPLAVNPRLTLNLQTSNGSITTDPVITNALSTIGNTNGYTINLGFGEYQETGPIVFNEKWQLQVVGPQSAGTTAATIKNGITIQNSNGVRLMRVQVEGTSSIACRTGLGIYAERSQFMGNVTLSGTGGFMMFIDCDFSGDITIPNTFAGSAYFVRCSFSKAAGVYTFNNSSAIQVIISDTSGIPNTSIAKASYSGMITYKNNTQALFVNGLPLLMSGTTASRPSTALTGFCYYDTTINKPVWRSGTSWRDSTGTVV